ncbi:DUF4931 domain-containing protein, partial [Bacillus mycoides]|uniref:DUF4931 domain-containing protein n=1 Tax=Bacillus mycoides TaxID=1405 RepID=UPI001F3112A3
RIRNKNRACAFCDRENLSDILEREECIMWLKKKFARVKDRFQTVVMERDNWDDDMGSYREEDMEKLIGL